MKIEVQFFSRLRDVVHAAKLHVELPAAATLQELLDSLYGTYPGLQAWDAHLLLAVGLDYAGRSQTLVDGDAVSIMPPVQGG